MRSSNETLICPYNKSHLIPLNRVQIHLTECKDKISPVVGFIICPYNSEHQLPSSLLEAHKQNCKDKPEDREDVLKQMQASIFANGPKNKPNQLKDQPPGFAPVLSKSKKKKKGKTAEVKPAKEDPNNFYLLTNEMPDPEVVGCIEGLQFGLPPGFESFHPEPVLEISVPVIQSAELKAQPQSPIIEVVQSKSQSPSKVQTPKTDEEWVTVKSKPKKKAPAKSESTLPVSQAEYSTLAEFQVSASNTKNKKTLKKKLKDIQLLEQAHNRGEKLDPQQLAKVQSKAKVERELAGLR